MTDGLFDDFEPATPDDAAFLEGFRSATGSLASLGLSPADLTVATWNIPALVMQVVASAADTGPPARIHILFRTNDRYRVVVGWTFDEYILDEPEELSDENALDARSAGEQAGRWLKRELSRGIFRDEWDGRRPFSRLRPGGEPAGRHRLRRPDRSIRVR